MDRKLPRTMSCLRTKRSPKFQQLTLVVLVIAVDADPPDLIIDSFNVKSKEGVSLTPLNNGEVALLLRRKAEIDQQLLHIGWKSKHAHNQNFVPKVLRQVTRAETASCEVGEEFASFRNVKRNGTSACDLFFHNANGRACTCRSVLKRMLDQQPTSTMRSLLSSMCCRRRSKPPRTRQRLPRPRTRPLDDTSSGLPFVTIPPQLGEIPAVPWPKPCNEFKNGKCAPAILIAGAKKCGTNSVAAMLKLHPYAKFKGQSQRGHERIKEAGGTYFNENWFLDCGVYNTSSAEWAVKLYNCNGTTPSVRIYSEMFVNTNWETSFAVDRSPMAGSAPGTAQRLHHIAPDARVVLVLCEPVARSWSSLNHENKLWLRSKWANASLLHRRLQSTTNAIANLTKKYGSSYADLVKCMQTAGVGGGGPKNVPHNTVCRELLLPGLYFDGLAQYYQYFKPHQLLVINGDWFFENQKKGAEYLFRALGVPAVFRDNGESPSVQENKGSVVNPGYMNITGMPPPLLATLLKVYDQTRRKMAELFGPQSIALPERIALEPIPVPP